MNRKIAVTLTLFAAALVAATAVTALARGPWDRPAGMEQRIDVLSRVLDLTPEQNTRIKEILKDEEKRRDDLREKHLKERENARDEMRALRDRTHDSVLGVLNDSQRAKLNALKELRDDRDCRGPGCSESDRDCRGPGCYGNDGDWGRGCGERQGRGPGGRCGPGCGSSDRWR